LGFCGLPGGTAAMILSVRVPVWMAAPMRRLAPVTSAILGLAGRYSIEDATNQAITKKYPQKNP